MKRILCTAFALSLLGGTAAIADDHDHDFNRHDNTHQNDRVHWGKGDHFSGHSVVIDDWQGHHLRRPPHGYHWVQTDDGDFILVAVSTGIILDLMLNGH
jgi:Ni/Co efflux regulator RcnB